jgi:protein-S-isoprenylcysteine O-methyltransferase
LSPLPYYGSPFDHALFWCTYLLWLILETVTSRRKRLREKGASRDRGSYAFLMIMLWTSLSLEFTMPFIAPKADMQRTLLPLFFTGVALMIAGLAFRFYSMSILGRFFTYSVAVQAGHTVVEAGRYRYIRHPSYTGAFMTLIGFGLAMGNWLGLACLLCLMGIGYTYRISVEEAALTAALGETYAQYMCRTRRLVPFAF